MPGACIPNVPFEISPLISTNTTWSTDPKHTFYATQYNDDAGKMDGFIWSAGKAGEAALGYYDLTGSYLFQLAQVGAHSLMQRTTLSPAHITFPLTAQHRSPQP